METGDYYGVIRFVLPQDHKGGGQRQFACA
jgi:hypothetical protein